MTSSRTRSGRSRAAARRAFSPVSAVTVAKPWKRSATSIRSRMLASSSTTRTRRPSLMPGPRSCPALAHARTPGRFGGRARSRPRARVAASPATDPPGDGPVLGIAPQAVRGGRRSAPKIPPAAMAHVTSVVGADEPGGAGPAGAFARDPDVVALGEVLEGGVLVVSTDPGVAVRRPRPGGAVRALDGERRPRHVGDLAALEGDDAEPAVPGADGRLAADAVAAPAAGPGAVFARPVARAGTSPAERAALAPLAPVAPLAPLAPVGGLRRRGGGRRGVGGEGGDGDVEAETEEPGGGQAGGDGRAVGAHGSHLSEDRWQKSPEKSGRTLRNRPAADGSGGSPQPGEHRLDEVEGLLAGLSRVLRVRHGEGEFGQRAV